MVAKEMPFSLPLICLLAGRSDRMGTPKQHVRVSGRTFLEHVLSTLGEVGPVLSPRLYVGREGDATGKSLIETAAGIWVVNPDPDRGPLSSIWQALEVLPRGQGFLLWPIDHPLVSHETLKVLCRAARDRPDALIVPSFQRRRGHPVVFPEWAIAELRKAPLDEGARWVFNRYPEKVFLVPVDDRWVRTNLDSPDLLAEAESALAGSTHMR